MALKIGNAVKIIKMNDKLKAFGVKVGDVGVIVGVIKKNSEYVLKIKKDYFYCSYDQLEKVVLTY